MPIIKDKVKEDKADTHTHTEISFISLCVCVPLVWQSPWSPEEGIRHLGTGIAGGSEPTEWVRGAELRPSGRASSMLSYWPSFQLWSTFAL